MKRDRAAAKAKTKTVAAKSTLFVNGIPFSATKHDIASHFSSAAQCDAEALLPRVRQIIKEGKFKGTAFVDMTDWASVDRGLALHGKKMVCADGTKRHINVREAVPKTQLQKQEAEAERAKAQGAVRRERRGAGASDSDSEDEGEASDEESAGEAVSEKDDEEPDHNGVCDPQRKKLKTERAYLEQRRELADMEVTCAQCAAKFIFTVQEQEFFLDKGWPVR
mgnify:CR=1 FL=1|jgi:hypothetical protein